jgi:16S rRNA (uracil1498-N3)-methyltransferase
MSTELDPPDFTKTRQYVDDNLSAKCEIILPSGPSHYLRTVMRREVGGHILLFNGRDGEWGAEIKGITKKAVTVVALAQTRAQDSVPDLELLFAPVKKTPLDFMVQKAAELGVRAMRPVLTRRTNVARVKIERIEANVIEAAEQSGRLTLPEVGEPVKLSALLSDWPEGRMLVFCDEAGEAMPLGRALEGQAQAHKGDPETSGCSILIGPEGGFDPAERDLLRQHPDVLPVTLGPRIMRADTAALAALAIWQNVVGDLGAPGQSAKSGV